MKVGIAGAGAIAMGYAALLLRGGHAVTVWSPSGASRPVGAENVTITVTGAIETMADIPFCDGPAELAQCDVLVLALPAYGHRFVIDKLLPHIESHQTIIISSHLSFAALYIAKQLAARNIEVPIVAWSTTVLTCKAQGPAAYRIGAIRSTVDMATVPARLSERALAICIPLFGERFAAKDDILTIALSNLNPQNHLSITLCNLTRIEHGESWGQNSNVTSSVGWLMEALDRERVAIAEAFHKRVRTIFEHYAMSYGLLGGSVAQMSQDLCDRGNDPLGPTNPATRYILEDVPFGLVPTLRLAEIVNVPAPLHRSGVAIIGACYGRAFEADNDLISALELGDAQKLKHLAIDGYTQ